MGVQLTHIMIQDQQTLKNLGFFTNTASKAIPLFQYTHVHVSSLSRGVHSPDFACN